MRALLQEDWLARYVAKNQIELPPLAATVPAQIAREIQKLESVSLCRPTTGLEADDPCGLDTGKHRFKQRADNRRADAYCTG